MRWALLIWLLAPSSASAWEGWCRDESDAARGSGFDAAVQNSLCEMDDLDRCDPGPESARGVQAGEHTYITLDGMRRAGLPAGAMAPFDFAYSSDDEDHLAPAALGGMSHAVTRRMHIAEFGEGPDISHSMSDFLLGNEHCFVPNVPARTEEDNEKCHQFEAHMGPINSTHWPELAREVYANYHAHALRIAARCKDMNTRRMAMGLQHAALDRARVATEECMREALSIESFAAHYLEDVWSTGHMWNRWGSPSVPTDDAEYLRAFFATAMTGIIHGARGVLKTHDQMCMPGPMGTNPAEEIVRFRIGDSASQPGGGDLYLLSCTQAMPGWNVLGMAGATDPPQMSSQYTAMTSCVGLGFREVYEAGAPVLGALGTATRPGGFPGQTPTKSTDDPCWSARLTNTSLRLGLGLTLDLPFVDPETFTAYDLANPAIWSRTLINIFVNRAGNMGRGNLDLELSDDELEREKLRFRIESTQLARRLIAAAADGESTSEAISAPMPRGLPREYLGVKRSGDFVGDVRNDRLGYLERHDATLWDDRGSMSCEVDQDCPMGQFCDGSLHLRFGMESMNTPACVPIEAGILRAFRNGELPYWCKREGSDALSLARDQCEQGGDCESCVDLLVPHIRNGCGPETFVPMRNGVDRRSLCEVMGVEENIVYAPYANGDLGSLRNVARELCSGRVGPDNLLQRIDTGSSDPTVTPPAETLPVHDLAFVSTGGFVCSGLDGSSWFRIRHAAGDPHVHDYAIVADDVSKLEVKIYAGPACTAEIELPMSVGDRDGDDRNDILTISENVPTVGQEICIRVRAAGDSTFWTNFRFYRLAALVGAG